MDSLGIKLCIVFSRTQSFIKSYSCYYYYFLINTLNENVEVYRKALERRNMKFIDENRNNNISKKMHNTVKLKLEDILQYKVSFVCLMSVVTQDERMDEENSETKKLL